ncbi:Scr1 family TA system antitoxin-like transcriptional regulator [Streptomyces antimycoticus]|uniref:Scr1 family TA system antitoxin-like transcriptional regulator n=1 Tax=Streptomyces antimycoticus TaxID=68175 RepID=UPI002571226C|nr:Scr1 family TA system antitoxin-like transcriptional regulator [Streptomyces antimycoticus]WJD96238.1 Scr1 family TA system antitoxin-like transcriptional regulator [Streptomyces antimycoticus]
MPFTAGEHAETGSSLTLFTVPHGALVAYDESSQSGTIIEDQETVARRRENCDLLRAMALSPRDSGAMIRAVMKDWSPCQPPRT